MSDQLPKDYVLIPLPTWGDVVEAQKNNWYGYVYRRARITDPMFHGGNTEAIQMVVGKTREPTHFAGRTWYREQSIPGDWIEFRNFKDANAYVQLWKRTL